MEIESIYTDQNKDVRELQLEETRVYMAILAIESQSAPGEYDLTPSGIKTMVGDQITPALKLLCERLDAVPDMKFNSLLVSFLAGFVDRPAIAVMIAHALVKETRKIGKTVSVSHWGESMAPFGVPVEERMKRIWYSQKMPDGNNYLDTKEAWE